MDRNDFKKFLAENAGRIVIVKAYADWCAPCKRVSPLIDSEIMGLVAEHGGDNVKFLQINIDDDADVASYIKIQKLPTMICYIEGQPIHAIVTANEPEIRDFFKKSSCSYSLSGNSGGSAVF
jgi:thioredoxin-like negative regulator of GroEL